TVATAAGGGGGLAGAVSVNTIEATTEALTATFGTRDTLVNQDAAFRPGGAFAPTSAQTFRLSADGTATLNDGAGRGAGGLVGMGAAVDVAAIRNRTVAQVGSDSLIFAQGNIDVLAHEDRDAVSTVIAISGGLVGLSGAISVVSLGAPADST